MADGDGVAPKASSDGDVSHAQFRALANSIPNLAWMAQPDGWIFWYNQCWYDYTGTTPEEMAGWGWQAVLHPDVLPVMLKRWTAALATGEPFEMTFPLRRGSDGSYRMFVTRAEPLRENGEIVGWFGTNTDITELERTRERLQLVVNELNHRVKNTLATAHSLALQTFRNSAEPERIEAFERRLLSLAAVHDLLTREGWKEASLAEVVDLTAATFGRRRFDICGDEVAIEPRLVSAMALTLHELATNAAKYGALSNEQGRVRIEWRVEPVKPAARRLVFTWSERNGPPVTEPTYQGFGLRLIRTAAASDSGAAVDHRFEPDGVTCRITLPLGDRILT